MSCQLTCCELRIVNIVCKFCPSDVHLTLSSVCIDTCHAFAAGHDLRTEASLQALISAFDKVIGLQYLRGLHLNDSKGDLGCKKDRHENIGQGKIGLEAFRCIMNETRFNRIPMILETPVR